MERFIVIIECRKIIENKKKIWTVLGYKRRGFYFTLGFLDGDLYESENDLGSGEVGLGWEVL